jgi:hypothetical protein
MYAGEQTEATLNAGARTLLDTPRAFAGMRELLADSDSRRELHGLMERLLGRADEVLGRWAGVMLSSPAYAEIIDHHVELYSRLAWVGSLLEYFEPTDDGPKRWRLTRSSPAVQLRGEFDDDWLSHNLVAIAQLAEALDEGSLQLALRIVPGEWWTARWQPPVATPGRARKRPPPGARSPSCSLPRRAPQSAALETTPAYRRSRPLDDSPPRAKQVASDSVDRSACRMRLDMRLRAVSPRCATRSHGSDVIRICALPRVDREPRTQGR